MMSRRGDGCGVPEVTAVSSQVEWVLAVAGCRPLRAPKRSASESMLARLVMQSRGADAAPPGEMLTGCYRLQAVSASHGKD